MMLNRAFHLPGDVKDARRMVIVALADQANDEGVCWPGDEHLCFRTAKDKRTVRRAVRWLEDHGYLSIAPYPGLENAYHLHLPEVPRDRKKRRRRLRPDDPRKTRRRSGSAGNPGHFDRGSGNGNPGHYDRGSGGRTPDISSREPRTISTRTPDISSRPLHIHEPCEPTERDPGKRAGSLSGIEKVRSNGSHPGTVEFCEWLDGEKHIRGRPLEVWAQHLDPVFASGVPVAFAQDELRDVREPPFKFGDRASDRWRRFQGQCRALLEDQGRRPGLVVHPESRLGRKIRKYCGEGFRARVRWEAVTSDR